jgi:thioredoxin reductase
MADYDVGIIGGGPAGLSAALVLGRCRRRVILFDHGKPRNLAAVEMHGYLGRDGIPPLDFRSIGRREAERYDVEFVDAEVAEVRLRREQPSEFEVRPGRGSVLRVRKLLLATGVTDCLPKIEHIADFYGKSVHHCPYCDGWEHRDKRLAALGEGDAAVGLALSLRTWSKQVTACTSGVSLKASDRQRCALNGIASREEIPMRLEGCNGQLQEIHFAAGPPLECDALFFCSDQFQRSQLPIALGCECDEQGLIVTRGKQDAGVRGLFLAGDADGDVQFAIVAAAEGATAATAINRELQDEDRG